MGGPGHGVKSIKVYLYIISMSVMQLGQLHDQQVDVPVGPGEMHPQDSEWRPGRSYGIMLDIVSLIRKVMSVYCA